MAPRFTLAIMSDSEIVECIHDVHAEELEVKTCQERAGQELDYDISLFKVL